MTTPYTYENSRRLFEKAAGVIPCGIYGHFSPAPLVPPEHYPFFAQQASGARFTDIDGNEFIDYMCAYGPMVLGYNYEPVDRAPWPSWKRVTASPAPARSWWSWRKNW